MNKVLITVAVLAVAAFATLPEGIRRSQDSDIIYLGTRPAYDETQFAGKNILITGGSSGIGYATALTFARFGANVAIVQRDYHPTWYTGEQAAAKILSDPIVKAKGGKVTPYKYDVSDQAQVKKLFQQFEKEKFMLDYAFNNAGIVGAVNVNATLFNETAKYFGGEHDAVHNNLGSCLLCMEAEIAQFKSSMKDGAIVNTASVNGYKAAPLGPLYPGSKFGIIGLSRSVGTEYARRTKDSPVVRVNAIAPGFTNTSLVWQQAKIMEGLSQAWEGEYITPDHELWKKWAPVFQGECPTGDLADPMDQANMVAFLLSDSAALITGSVFTVDGLIGE